MTKSKIPNSPVAVTGYKSTKANKVQRKPYVSLSDVRVKGAAASPLGIARASITDAISASRVRGVGDVTDSPKKLIPIPSPPGSINLRYRPPSYTPPVVTSATADIYASITGTPYTDLYAAISANRDPFIDASIVGVGSDTKDISATIQLSYPAPSNLYASILAFLSTNTSPLEYEVTMVGTSSGASILRRLLTAFPDLTASIRGWYYNDIEATITAKEILTGDLYANIFGIGVASKDLVAYIQSFTTKDITASVNTNVGKYLYGSVTSVPPSDLPAYLFSIAPSDLPAYGGGHLPSYLSASLIVVEPKPLYAYIIAGYSGTSDLIASVTGTGGFYNLNARIYPRFSSYSNLLASITVRGEKPLYGYISGWDISSLYASVEGVYSADIGGYIAGYKRDNTTDVLAFIRSSFAGESAVASTIYGWISAHTTDKPYNFNYYGRFKPTFIGTEQGLSLLKVEPIRGYFPDLHAVINAVGLKTNDLPAYIVGLLRDQSLLSASISAVTKIIHIDKLVLRFYNLSDLAASIWTSSDIKPLFGSIRGHVSTHTGTVGGYWVYKSIDHIAYLAADASIRIVRNNKNSTIPLYYYNESNVPDLRAAVYSWAVSSLPASIRVRPYADIGASLSSRSADHISSIFASLQSYSYASISASIYASGGYSDVYATVVPGGAVSSVSASIYPYVKILGFAVIPVETKPFSILRATIGPVSPCVGTSTYSAINAFINGFEKSTSSVGLLGASIYSSTDTKHIGASITARRKVFYSKMSFILRTLNRRSSVVRTSIIGVGSSSHSVAASITGDFLTSSLSASISAVRYNIRLDEKDNLIHVYKTSGNHMELYKTIRYYMSSGVRSYIYDSLDKLVYPADNGKWVLRLETFTVYEKAFFDRDENDTYVSLGVINEYDTIDEAIRAAIDLLVNRRNSTLSASITATGSVTPITATIGVIPADKSKALTASLYTVYNAPILSASIYAAGYMSHLPGYITGKDSSTSSLGAYMNAYDDTTITASIVGTT